MSARAPDRSPARTNQAGYRGDGIRAAGRCRDRLGGQLAWAGRAMSGALDPPRSEDPAYQEFAAQLRARPSPFRGFSSSNQLSTTISLSEAAGTGRIIRKRRSSGETAYPLIAGNISNPAVEKSRAARPRENVGLVLTFTVIRFPSLSR